MFTCREEKSSNVQTPRKKSIVNKFLYFITSNLNEVKHAATLLGAQTSLPADLMSKERRLQSIGRSASRNQSEKTPSSVDSESNEQVLVLMTIFNMRPTMTPSLESAPEIKSTPVFINLSSPLDAAFTETSVCVCVCVCVCVIHLTSTFILDEVAAAEDQPEHSRLLVCWCWLE